MKHLRKTETNKNFSIVIIFTILVICVISTAIVISACAESLQESDEKIEPSIIEPTTALIIPSIATPDDATKDQVQATQEKETSESTQPEETCAPATEPVLEDSSTEFEDTEEYQAYGEQTYDVNEDDYEFADEADNETSNYNRDTDLLAKVIYLEAGDCSEYCQWLVGSTAMNLADQYGGLSAVAYNYNIFNVSYQLDSCIPSSLSYDVAERIISGDRDYNVMAFRDGYYHSFGTPYESVDGVYFSTY